MAKEIPTGWECPRCHKINAPTVKECSCAPVGAIPYPVYPRPFYPQPYFPEYPPYYYPKPWRGYRPYWWGEPVVSFEIKTTTSGAGTNHSISDTVRTKLGDYLSSRRSLIE